MLVCGIIMVIAVLIHDGDHIRQALNWGYHIPLAIWALNLTVYIFPFVTVFLAKSRRMSVTLVGAVGGIFTSASFVILHLCGSATGLWGVWNFSYFELMPCGVLYAMWLHAVSGGNAVYGAGSMLAFALGTVPLLLLFGAFGAFMPRKWNKYLVKASAVLITSMGTKMLIAGLHML